MWRRRAPAGAPPPRRRRFGCLVVVVLVALAAGHYLFWYSARPRAGAPSAGSFAADLLAGDDYQACLWLPYPHQNLAMLADEVGDVDRYLAAVAEVAGLPELDVPRFGPFRAPPAREIVVASADDGERFVAAAQVYAGLALVAKLAGRIASNPWLAGGEVELSGRPARVRWQGRLWLLEPTDAEPIEARARVSGREGEGEASFARIRLTEAMAIVPAGDYRWRRQGDGFALTGGRSWRPAALEDPLAASVVAVAFQAGGGLLDRGAQAGVLLETAAGSSLPGAAVLSRPGGKRWKLPGEGLLSRLRGELPTAEVAGWSVTAFNETSLAGAREVALRLAPLADDSRTLNQALWLRPAPTAHLVDEVAGALEAVPFVGKHRARRWRAWATVLEPLVRYERLTVEVGRNQGELHVELRGSEEGEDG